MSLADFPNLTTVQRAKARHNAIAFRIWQVCKGCDWNMTASEVAAATGYPVQSIINVATKNGRINLLRSARTDTGGYGGRHGTHTPRALDDFFAGPDDLSLVDHLVS